MWRTGSVLTVLAVVGSLGCVSTARFDDAHRRRVAAIDARYTAELEQPAEPAVASSPAPFLLASDAGLASPRPDRQAAPLAARQRRTRLDAERQAAVTASLAQRDREIAADRAAHRARVQANAFAAAEPGPAAAALCLDAAEDQPLLRTAGCRLSPRTHDRAPAQVSQPARK